MQRHTSGFSDHRRPGAGLTEREIILSIARSVAGWRQQLKLTQSELGRRAGLSQATVSAVERGRIAELPIGTAVRLLEALEVRVRLDLQGPPVFDVPQHDAVHSRCVAHVRGRLEAAGWRVASEVEILTGRSHGWIDLLAFDPATECLLVIEVKTAIEDIGAIERTLGWYEREAWAAARRLGWRPRSVVGVLVVLCSEVNDDRIRANRESLRLSFPIRTEGLAALVAMPAAGRDAGRALAMVDPLSRRASWLIRTRVDGRRSAAPYRDYADAAARLAGPRRRGRGPGSARGAG